MMADVVSIESLQRRIKETEKNGNQKVCVVCVMGRCHLEQKNGILNKLVDHSVFRTNSTLHPFNKTNVNKNKEGEMMNDGGEENPSGVEVKMFYDQEQKTVFVQLNSVYDYGELFKTCKLMHKNVSMLGRHKIWQDKLLKHAMALLFVFSISHIVVVMFPTPRFDLSYLRLFKLLAASRYNMLHGLSQSLNSVEGIPEIWRTTGRPCIPRIIFSFQVPWASAKGLNQHSIRKMQLSLQEQTHLILKKNRLLGSLSSSSLFTVSSPNQLFVHVQTENRTTEPMFALLNYSLRNSLNTNSTSGSSGHNGRASLNSQSSPSKILDENGATKDVSLRDFLYKQIDYMMTVESREVPAEGRRGTHVEAPTVGLWYRVCEIVYGYFLGNIGLENNPHVKSLSQSLDLDWKFSENRCHKVSPMATNAYLDNLPSHYVQSVHLAQLSHSIRVFAMNARGPAYEHYVTQLQEECNQVWWSGRHLCEVMSMTGQPCVYPYHNIPDGKADNTEEKTGIPVKSHSSRVTCVSACNCGRTQGTREDPFDLKDANYEFYQNLEKKCCSYLIHLRFPSFPIDDPSVKEKTKPSLQKRLETHQITILGRKNKALVPDISYSCSTPSQPPAGNESMKDIPVHPGTEQQDNIILDSAVLENEESSKLPLTGDENEEGLSDRLSSMSGAKNLTTGTLSYGGNLAVSEGTATAPDDVDGSYLSQFEEMVEASKQLSVSVVNANDGKINSNSISDVNSNSNNNASSDMNSNINESNVNNNGSNDNSHSSGNSNGNTSNSNNSSSISSTSNSSKIKPVDPQSSSETTDSMTSSSSSGLDYYEGMFTTNIQQGLLPLFPSWSLIVLGPASLYNPAKGIEQAGFFAGSNFLLQWDIFVKYSETYPVVESKDEISTSDASSQEEQWPAPGEVAKPHQSPGVFGPASHVPFFQTMSQVQNQVSDLAQSDRANKMKLPNFKETTPVKAYIGNEYECPRGHRFFCSAPDKMVKVSATGHVRENASKLISGHMPLYFPCPCRSSKPVHLAQITRTYVVTPDSSVTVALNPRVQPGERDITPVFYTGLREGITLPPSSYCVLRYPYVYVDYNGPILPPAPTQPLLTCRLLKGMFSYSHTVVNEEGTLQP